MFSLIFIKRPKLAAVIAIALFIAGAICAFRLPISEYPTVAPPQVTVTAYYAGASADEIANTVAAPIETEVNTVEDILYYDSKSDNSGNYTLTVTFKPGANEDMALVNVNNAVKLVEPKLPSEVKATGVTVRKQSSDMLCAIGVHSSNPAHSLIDVSTFVDIRIKDAVARIDGVGSVQLHGEAKRSMRCWLDPEKMRALGISVDEVKKAISSQNLQAAAGSVGADRAGDILQYKILADGRLKTAEQFEDIVIRSSEDGFRFVRMRDIARVELGAEKYGSSCKFNGENAVMMAVYKLNKGNALDIFNDIMKVMADVEKSMPEGMSWDFAYDSTTFVKASMQEIVVTIFETFLLVVLITWIFLQSWRATLIPTVAIPVSLVGTFLFLQLFGMSVNTLTMFALILVIGSVVDDAICVTESCMTKLQAGMDRLTAAVETMKEISGALVATTLVVVAVYAPIGFAQGMVGTIYLQFSVTMCIALILSTVCALSLSCALAALVMKKPAEAKGFFRWFNVLFDRLRDGAAAISAGMIRVMPLTLAVFVAISVAAVWLFKSIPPAFVENEDRATIFVEVTLPPGTVLARTEEVSHVVAKRIGKMEEVKSVTEVPGMSMTAGTGENLAYMLVKLTDWEVRPGSEHSVAAVQKRILMELADIAEAKVVAFVPPPIMGLGVAGGVSFLLQGLESQSYPEIARAAQELTDRLMNSGKALYAYSTFDAATPLVKFSLDRQMAELMGVRVSDVFAALQGQLGSYYVNDFNLDSKNYQVNIQADLKNRATTGQLNAITVTGAKGAQVPIYSIGTFNWTVGPRQVERFNMFASAAFQAAAAPGVSSGELMREIEKQVAELGAGWQVSYTDLSYQERQNEGEIIWMLILSIVMAYLFLVGQYENWTVPIPVMLCVLVALFGGLLGIKLSGISMNIYCQLGVLMLIGVTAKSAILIAEYAMQKEQAGMPLVEAAIEGMKQRFRSVQMTALSFVIGVLPLLFATGAGANSRHAVGVATFWGMLTAAVVGMFFVPPLYVFFRRLAGVKGKGKAPAVVACILAAGMFTSANAADVTVDFADVRAKFRPALHSSGYGALYERAHLAKWDAYVKEMNFDAVRTHDLALINSNARVFDSHHIFPLMHLDATKAENYYFKPTDFMMRLQQQLGLKVFYRLGTSIEHTGLVHFNAEIPADFDKVAESFAGTVRHYSRGWAEGMTNAVCRWEIWNEPDGLNNMWSFNGGVNDRDAQHNRNDERRDLFVKFFVTCLKRLKSEFPEQKVGGPALCTMREDWFRPLLRACKAAGVAPDFLSWHYYGNDPERMFVLVDAAQKLCAEEGFPQLEFIINEWHYVCKAGWGRNAATRAPDNMNDINSACFSLTTLSRLQTSRYDQAFFYGCRHYGNWGFSEYGSGELNKTFYAMKTFGSIKRTAAAICATTSSDKAVTAFATTSADGKVRKLLVVDYFGRDPLITVRIKGGCAAQTVKAEVLSFEKNLEPLPVKVQDGKFTLKKPDAYSAAFLVTFN